MLHLTVKIEAQLASEKKNSKRYAILSLLLSTIGKRMQILKIYISKLEASMRLTKRTKLRPPRVKRKWRNTRRFEKEIETSNVENIKELVILVMIVLTRVMIIKNGQVVTDSEESDQDELVEEIQENEEELEDGSHLALVTRRFLKTQVTENDVDDQRDNLFHTRCLVKGTLVVLLLIVEVVPM